MPSWIARLPGLLPVVPLLLPSVGVDTVALTRYRLDGPPSRRFTLAAPLEEISGLAVTDDGRLFAHGDERAVIHQLDPLTGRIVKSFSLGKHPVKGDFEDIAIMGTRFFLITSDGDLYQTREGADGDHLDWSLTRTGLGAQCEIEGLAYEPAGGSLLVLCKEPRVDALRGTITIFRLPLDSLQDSIDHRQSPIDNAIHYRLKTVLRKTHTRHFHPSAIARDPVTGHYLVLAAREQAIAELTPDGDVVAGLTFPPGLHPQAEGIAVLPDATLLISDEAAGGAASLSLYFRAR